MSDQRWTIYVCPECGEYDTPESASYDPDTEQFSCINYQDHPIEGERRRWPVMARVEVVPVGVSRDPAREQIEAAAAVMSGQHAWLWEHLNETQKQRWLVAAEEVLRAALGVGVPDPAPTEKDPRRRAMAEMVCANCGREIRSLDGAQWSNRDPVWRHFDCEQAGGIDYGAAFDVAMRFAGELGETLTALMHETAGNEEFQKRCDYLLTRAWSLSSDLQSWDREMGVDAPDFGQPLGAGVGVPTEPDEDPAARERTARAYAALRGFDWEECSPTGRRILFGHVDAVLRAAGHPFGGEGVRDRQLAEARSDLTREREGKLFMRVEFERKLAELRAALDQIAAAPFTGMSCAGQAAAQRIAKAALASVDGTEPTEGSNDG